MKNRIQLIDKIEELEEVLDSKRLGEKERIEVASELKKIYAALVVERESSHIRKSRHGVHKEKKYSENRRFHSPATKKVRKKLTNKKVRQNKEFALNGTKYRLLNRFYIDLWY